MEQIKHMLNASSSVRLTRRPQAGRIIKPMLDKSDIGKRFAEECRRLRLSSARIAEKTGVTIQAVYGWIATGRIARKHHATFKGLGIDVAYLLTGERREILPPQSVSDDNPKLSQSDLDLLAGYRTLTQELQTAVWDIIDSHMRRQHPDLAKALGRRDIAKSLSAEPRIATKQIIAQSRTTPTKRTEKK